MGEKVVAQNSALFYCRQMISKRQETQVRRRKLHEAMRALTYEPLMRGTIIERTRRCGKESCACAKDSAARHHEKYLSIRLNGKTVAISLRPEDEERAQLAIAAYHKLREIIDELTSCEVADLRRAARERARGRKRRRGT
jgi:hypothetical protein